LSYVSSSIYVNHIVATTPATTGKTRYADGWPDGGRRIGAISVCERQVGSDVVGIANVVGVGYADGLEISSA
jgi:hypothetical protein